MTSITQQKYNARESIAKMLKWYLTHVRQDLKQTSLNFAGQLAERMTLNELSDWKAQLCRVLLQFGRKEKVR